MLAANFKNLKAGQENVKDTFSSSKMVLQKLFILLVDDWRLLLRCFSKQYVGSTYFASSEIAKKIMVSFKRLYKQYTPVYYRIFISALFREIF